MESNDLGARSEPKMEGIAQQNMSARGAHVLGRHPFNSAVGTNRHKRGRLHLSTLKMENTPTRKSVCCCQRKIHD